VRFSPLSKPLLVALVAGLAMAACDQAVTSPEAEVAPAFAKADHGRPDIQTLDRIASFVDGINARLEASGQTLRLDYPWLYTVGLGTDPYQTLRTGSRWPYLNPTYVIDVADLSAPSIGSGDAAAAIQSAYSAWNGVPQSRLSATRGPNPRGDVDVLDAIVRDPDTGECVDIFDEDADIVQGPSFFPVADIVVGGFLPVEYFNDCLGSPYIIAVTWTYSDVDHDGDQYRDRLYVEQYYNPIFPWVTQGAQYPDLSLATGVDFETIALHENGHAHGLGHFGGPLLHQDFKQKGNGAYTNPLAVMNPYYVGGELRTPLATDEAALKTMYSGWH
jgi:hypothetical protein